MHAYKLSFDGCGLNDANDKYKKRLFTMRSEDRDSLKDCGEYIERSVNAHAALVEALEEAYALLDNSNVRHYVSTKLGEQAPLHSALNKTRKALTLAKEGA